MRAIMLAGTYALAVALSACSGGGSGAVSVSPTAGGATTVGPSPAGCEPSSQQSLIAAGLKFDRTCMAVPAHHPTFLTLTNNDPWQSHDVAIYRWDSCFAQAVRAGDPSTCADPSEGLRYKGSVITHGQVTYHILGVRPGRYAFICTVHPSMYGVLKAA